MIFCEKNGLVGVRPHTHTHTYTILCRVINGKWFMVFRWYVAIKWKDCFFSEMISMDFDSVNYAYGFSSIALSLHKLCNFLFDAKDKKRISNKEKMEWNEDEKSSKWEWKQKQTKKKRKENSPKMYRYLKNVSFQLYVVFAIELAHLPFAATY